MAIDKSKYFSCKIKYPQYGTNFFGQSYLSLMSCINLLLITWPCVHLKGSQTQKEEWFSHVSLKEPGLAVPSNSRPCDFLSLLLRVKSKPVTALASAFMILEVQKDRGRKGSQQPSLFPLITRAQLPQDFLYTLLVRNVSR